MTTLKLTQIRNAVGLILPKECWRKDKKGQKGTKRGRYPFLHEINIGGKRSSTLALRLSRPRPPMTLSITHLQH